MENGESDRARDRSLTPFSRAVVFNALLDHIQKALVYVWCRRKDTICVNVHFSCVSCRNTSVDYNTNIEMDRWIEYIMETF